MKNDSPPYPYPPKDFAQAIEEWEIFQSDDPNNKEKYESPTQRNVTYRSYTQATPIGGPIGAQNGVKDLTGFDTEKFRLRPVPTKDKNPDHQKYQLYALSQHIVICPPSRFMDKLKQENFNILLIAPEILGTGSNTTINVTPKTTKACTSQNIVYDDDLDQSPTNPIATKTITIYTRSVEGMIQYLGALVKDSEKNDGATNSIGFYVRKGQSADARVSFAYVDGSYYIAPDGPKEHTLQILGLIEQLLNLRKNSKEITTTPATQLVP